MEIEMVLDNDELDALKEAIAVQDGTKILKSQGLGDGSIFTDVTIFYKRALHLFHLGKFFEFYKSEKVMKSTAYLIKKDDLEAFKAAIGRSLGHIVFDKAEPLQGDSKLFEDHILASIKYHRDHVFTLIPLGEEFFKQKLNIKSNS